MKCLLLVRHAKSSWDLDVEDFERPLNHRGQKDAPEMAERLVAKGIRIDGFVSSPAKRAFTTASIFTRVFGKETKDIISLPDLYEPSIQAFNNAIGDFSDDLGTVAVFSHNPTITNFANQLSPVTIDDMPTCGVFAVKADVATWKDFRHAPKQFWFFDFPKSAN